MNLKEAFRYQSFLDNRMLSAAYSFKNVDHILKVKKLHLKSESNPDTENEEELVDVGDFFNNDDVLRFMVFLLGEKEKLTNEITKAKSKVGFDIDSAIETNKYRQMINGAIKEAIRYKPSSKTESGIAYKFNVEGNQTSYRYNIEVKSEDNFNRANAKKVMRGLITEADGISNDIDFAMVTADVEYDPPFDVNDTFEDMMEEFVASYAVANEIIKAYSAE